jgi:predicted ATP-dependent endonuclease of OLD family
MEKLKRLVERPFGELLFASAIVMGDGATERAFLPIVIRHGLPTKAHGVCVIDPGSLGSELAEAAVKFARLVDIPWLLFSDSDDAGKQDAARLLDHYAGGDEAHVVWIARGQDADDAAAAIERMLVDFDESMCRSACLDVRPDLDQNQETIKLLKRLKGSSGTALARRLISAHPDVSTWPEPLRTLVGRLDGML